MTVYVNNYAPLPKPDLKSPHFTTPVESYDFNYCFEVRPLKSDRVELRPFVPSVHASQFYDAYARCNPDIAKWITPFDSLEDLLIWSETTIRRVPGAMTYAIFTAPPTSEPGTTPSEEYDMAGMISMINSDVEGMTSELGWIIIFDWYQRTHVLTHAAGLVMHRILDMPPAGGLGLRRCQWFTTTLNEKSQAASLRLGFSHEGVWRAHRVLAPGRIGARPGREGDYKEDCMTRDTWSASVSWDQWEGGVREHVDRLMARRK